MIFLFMFMYSVFFFNHVFVVSMTADWIVVADVAVNVVLVTINVLFRNKEGNAKMFMC